MIHKMIILAASSLFLMNCHARKEAGSLKAGADQTKMSASDHKNGNMIYFNEGENKFLKEYQMNVTFKGISEDSRCPKDVNCIWAGVAVAQVEVMGTATRPVKFELASTDNKSRNYSTSATFNGYIITLADVQPYPGAAEGTKALAGKYRIGITIKKQGEESTMK